MNNVELSGSYMIFFCDFDPFNNERILSEQRGTLISVSSFTFFVVMIVLSAWMGWIMG